MSRSSLPRRVYPSNPYFLQTVPMGPTRIAGWWVHGVDFEVTDWGCLERDETAPPHASPGRRSSRTIDHLTTHYDERALSSDDAAKFGASRTFEAVTVCGQYVLITERERTL